MYKSFPMVRHFIKTHGGNDDDARDVFQECLLVFYRNVQKENFSLTASLGTYLFSVSKYIWKDELKKKNRMVSFEVSDVPEEAVTYKEEEIKMRWIDKILDKLGDKCSEILQLFYYKKMTMEEIAEKLQYKNVDTVKTQKYKCMERAKAMAGEVKLSSINEEL